MQNSKLTQHVILKTNQSGQALVTLLFFMIIAITVIAAAIAVIYINNRATTRLEGGTIAYYVAESGIENALLRLLRDPGYTGEIIQIDLATVVIQVTGTEPKTVTSTATSGQFVRKLQTVIGYTNNILTISSWKEIP